MSNDYRPGDVNLLKCTLSSLDGKRTFECLNQVVRIDLYESVIQPLIHGEIVMADSVGLLRGFPIIGEESIRIVFETPQRKRIDHVFNVYHASDAIRMPGGKTMGYVLKVVSPEAYKNSSTLVAQRFKGQISNFVPEIVSNQLASSKSVEVEATKGIDDHLIGNLTPLQTVDKFRHRAVSASNASSSYVFYESFGNGFRFITLESLIAKAAQPAITFFYDDNLVVDMAQSKFRDVIAYEPIQIQDALQRIQSGSMANVVQRFDITTGSLVNFNYDSNQFDDAFGTTGATPNRTSSSFSNQFGQNTSRKFLVPFDSSQNDNFIAEKVGVLQSFVHKVTQNITHMLVPGDSGLELGTGVKCVVSESTAMTKQTTTSNNHVVTKIRHMILNSNRPVYTQSLEMLTNSYDT